VGKKGYVVKKAKRKEREGYEDYESVARDLKAKGVPEKREMITYANGTVDRVENKIAIRTFPIVIGIPMDEVMFSLFFTMFQRNVHPMPWDGLAVTLSTYLPDARNQVHAAFLKEKMYSHLFMIDSDVIPPPNVVERLMAHEKPIIGGYYLNKHPIMINTPVVYDFVKDDENGKATWMHRAVAGEGVEKVGGMGMGCVLMRRDVAEALGEKPYDMNAGGEDLVMCRKLMRLGIDLYVDWSVACAHMGVKWS
jgi:hypothetical protein